MATSPIKILRWTLDGAAVLYAISQHGILNLWKQSLDGSTLVQVTSFTSDDIVTGRS